MRAHTRLGWVWGALCVMACHGPDGPSDKVDDDTVVDSDTPSDHTDANTDTDPDTDTDGDTDTNQDTFVARDTGGGLDTDPAQACDTDAGADLTFQGAAGCYLSYTTPLPWVDAEAQCVSVGAHLASVTSKDEAFDIRLRTQGAEVWLGGTDAGIEGRWTWTDGQPLAFEHWAGEQPDNADRAEDCLHAYATSRWNDAPCADPRPYVCEVSACGNGQPDAGEACDDGNAIDGDGCDRNCTASDCGNDVIAGGEQCDDGNTVSDDGCEDDCTLACGAGDGAVRAWSRGGTCWFALTAPQSWDEAEAACAAAGAHLPSVHSDEESALLATISPTAYLGLRDDDGDGPADLSWVSGDGTTYTRWDAGQPDLTSPDPICTALVGRSPYWQSIGCDARGTTLCEVRSATCGDGLIGRDETCDDSNSITDPCDYGAASCTVCGAWCTSTAGATSTCGDGVADTQDGESCDDAIYASAGCNACVVDDGYACFGVPSTCFENVWSAGPDLFELLTDDGYDGTLGSMTCVPIEVSAGTPLTVGRVAVLVGIDHPWIGDLTIKLVSPAGTVITLASQPGWLEADDNGEYDGMFPSAGQEGADLSKDHPIVFADGVAPSAEAMGRGLTRNLTVCETDGVCAFAPQHGSATRGQLKKLAGEQASGEWRVCVGDSGGADVGQLDRVSIWVDP